MKDLCITLKKKKGLYYKVQYYTVKSIIIFQGLYAILLTCSFEFPPLLKKGKIMYFLNTQQLLMQHLLLLNAFSIFRFARMAHKAMVIVYRKHIHLCEWRGYNQLFCWVFSTVLNHRNNVSGTVREAFLVFLA